MKRKNPNRREERLAESKIFELRKKAARFLQAGDVAEFNRLQSTIAHLQEVHGVVLGCGKEENSERIA